MDYLQGTYTLYYRDANLCTNDEIFTLNDPVDLLGTLNINTVISCNAICDASIQFSIDNTFTGTPGYTLTRLMEVHLRIHQYLIIYVEINLM